MKTKHLPLLLICVFSTYKLHCQDVTITSNCGLFSPHQVDMEDYLKIDSYNRDENPNINLEAVCLQDKKNINVEILLELSSSGKPVKRKPLNICFALDRSASMEENNRMEKLKSAMKEILSLLTPDDFISIVAYDDLAYVVLPSKRYSKKNDSIFRDVIDRITIGGGTNMLAGMMKGYEELKRNHNAFYRNRLILMSDGVSTTGERDPARILKHTIYHYSKGTETSSIGIGNNINFNLLHDISVEGRGKSYFVGDCDSAYIDIEYVLKEEFYNMNANMEDIQVEISYPKYFNLVNVYGALKVIQDDDNEQLTVLCSNLSQKNQLILLKFQTRKRLRKDPITVNLYFMENLEKKNIEKQITNISSNNNKVSEKILLANKIINAVNSVKNRLLNQQYGLEDLDRLLGETNVPDSIVLLRQRLK
jgi:Mg-chelatase subunit ChlD